MTTLEKIRAEIFEKWKDEPCAKEYGCLDEVLEIIDKYAEQEPKTGHWILTDDDFVYCSECEDSYYPRPIDASWYYCPHCGCRMVEPEAMSEEMVEHYRKLAEHYDKRNS